MLSSIYHLIEAHLVNIVGVRVSRPATRGANAEVGILGLGIFGWQFGEYPSCCRILRRAIDSIISRSGDILMRWRTVVFFFCQDEYLCAKKEIFIMKNTVFTGAATAIVTPLNENGIDFENFRRLIEWQIASGIDAIVAVGTTGEGSTLNDQEHKDAIKFCVDVVAGRVPVIAGTGSNDISYAIELTKFSCEVGADAMLLVTPYYNKATQNGLIKSFEAIADASTKPCILYNVPSRTGCNLTPQSMQILAKHPNIVGIKEASGNLSQIAELAHLCGDEIDIYSGNDDQIVPIMSLGGSGVISVLSNIMPAETSRMCHAYLEGNVKEATRLQLDLFPLIKQLFVEVNPIPVKAAVAKMGYCDNYLRLPLTPMEDKHAEVLYDLMREQNLI